MMCRLKGRMDNGGHYNVEIIGVDGHMRALSFPN